MATVIESFKQKTTDGNLSEEYVFGVTAENVLFENNVNLNDKIKELTNQGYAPISHAAESDTYGRGSKDKYGHVRLSDEVTDENTETSGIATTPKAVATAVADKAPSAHRYNNNGTIEKGYKADGSYYGHVQLSNSIDSTSGTDAGIAATPAAVNAVKKLTYKMTLDTTTSTLTIEPNT